MITPALAMDRLSMMRAVRMGFGGEGVGDLMRDDEERMLPP